MGTDGEIISMAKTKADKTMAFNREMYGEVIRDYRTMKDMTQAQLAAKLATTKNTVSNWENGFSRPDVNVIPDLCKALGLSLAAFFQKRSEEKVITPAERLHLRRYSSLELKDRNTVDALTEYLFGVQEAAMRERCMESFVSIFHNDNMAAAGTLNMLDDSVSGESVFIRRDAITERADEIITVTGDSMEPTYYAGDDLLIEHTETLSVGEIGIFIINGEGFVKEYRGNGVYSHNEAEYPFRKFCEGDDVRVIGRVLGKVEKSQRPTKDEAKILNELSLDGSF